MMWNISKNNMPMLTNISFFEMFYGVFCFTMCFLIALKKSKEIFIVQECTHLKIRQKCCHFQICLWSHIFYYLANRVGSNPFLFQLFPIPNLWPSPRFRVPKLFTWSFFCFFGGFSKLLFSSSLAFLLEALAHVDFITFKFQQQ